MPGRVMQRHQVPVGRWMSGAARDGLVPAELQDAQALRRAARMSLEPAVQAEESRAFAVRMPVAKRMDARAESLGELQAVHWRALPCLQFPESRGHRLEMTAERSVVVHALAVRTAEVMELQPAVHVLRVAVLQMELLALPSELQVLLASQPAS